jgi:serine/threonine protein kinase
VDIQSLSADDPRSLGRYELLGRLGRGSQGIVFLARDPASGNQQVAVKLLRAQLDGDDAARSRFLREVEAAKRVARFCTAQVLDANVEGTQPYVVSEYIAGQSLAEVIRSGGPRGGSALDRIAVNTATALGAIHRAGIVHRDFKAANVLLGPDGPVVIDFGVAKALGSVEHQVTLTGQQVGTPAYMAPEQFRDDQVGPEADIFAWGVTMVFAATGTLPFGDGSIPAVMYRILNEDPDLGRLNGPLRDLVAACLAKNPAARPTARQIVDHLMGAQPTQPSGTPVVPPAAVAAADPPSASASQTGAGQAGYTIDPLHNVSMRQNAGSSVATGAPPLMPAGGPTLRRGLRKKPRIPRAALIAAAVVIVLAGGTAVGLTAFTSPSPSNSGTHDTAAGATTGGTPSAAGSPVASRKSTGKSTTTSKNATSGTSKTGSTSGTSGSSGHGGGGSSPDPHTSSSPAPGASTGSGAGGSTTVTRYDAPDDITSGNLAPVGDVSDIPYFEPVSGDHEWLDDIHRCEVIGSDGTTEGIICLDLVEDNPGNGTTYYAPVLTAYCQTISNSVAVQCANITGNFTMYGPGNVQETPEEYAWCGHSASNPCNDVKNYFIDLSTSAWMSVSTAAGSYCDSQGGTGTDCEMWPYAISGVDIELPQSDKNVTTGTGYTGTQGIGY